jgi:amidase
MFAMPDAAQLVELAASLNLRLSHKEAELYLPFVFEAMRQLDAFVQSRTEESTPPLLFPERGRGYRPTLSEDRYQAWLWKCEIGGSERGLLAGRTVSFKGPYQRGRHPAGVHLAGYGGIYPRR